MGTSPIAGKVQTVLGPVDPESLGPTITHEHLLIDFTVVFMEPSNTDDAGLARENLSLGNLGWIRHNWNSSLDNLRLLDEGVATSEAAKYFEAGGRTMVDVTSNGLGRDPEALARISRGTGLNVVMGGGHYISATHPAEFEAFTAEDIAETIIRDIEVGADGTDIRTGIIGEVGVSSPWNDSERKTVQAAVIAQNQTGAPVLIHPGRDEELPRQILDAMAEWGGDMSHTVMGHIERTIYSRDALKRVADTGAYLNFDLFGHDSSFYPLAPYSYMPNDAQRMDQIEFLIDEGHVDQILLAHDVCSKHRLKEYGGHGWDHIVARVVPQMQARGISQGHIDRMLIGNPREMLTFT
ncbi:MAG: aryldialkylphosphatase [Chloroflexi bacterium]|nr:aryldialkylphosphatase [Chloroflexota bacterium]MBT5319334.1 aryldialkylphosphatase [Chloroflexota bacterium]MBT6680880.1 aryldialkylphosphatase [Chloroflexota bacterium]